MLSECIPAGNMFKSTNQGKHSYRRCSGNESGKSCFRKHNNKCHVNISLPQQEWLFFVFIF